MEDRIRALEERVAQLEAALRMSHPNYGDAGTTLQTPLRITNSAGHVILEIDERRNDRAIRLFNHDGIAVATLGVDGTQAGYLALRNEEGALLAVLDIELSGARLQVLDHAGRGGVVVFGGDSGEDAGGHVNLLHPGDNAGISISLWATPNGGELHFYDPHSDAMILKSLSIGWCKWHTHNGNRPSKRIAN